MKNVCATLKYLIKEQVRLFSLDFDSTLFVYFPVCSFIFLIFSTLFVYYIMFVYYLGQNNVPNKAA